MREVTKFNLSGRLLMFALLVPALLMAANFGWAGHHEKEPALAIEHSDSDLEWGPCPEFFGEGCYISVLHGNPADPNTDVFFRMSGGKSFPPHRHTSAERMVMLAGVMEVTYENQDSEQLQPGTYAYGPAQRVHHGRCVSSEDCVLFIAFEQAIDAFEIAAQ